MIIYNLTNSKDKFNTTKIEFENEVEDNHKKFSLDNSKLSSIKKYIDDKQQLLEDIKYNDCTLSNNAINLIGKNTETNDSCRDLLKKTSNHNFKVSSLLDKIENNQSNYINVMNQNVNEYKRFTTDYSITKDPEIQNSLDYVNSHLQMKSFNDNAPTLEMMQDTLEFSNKVPEIIEEENFKRLYPYNFKDFNGLYSISLGQFNPIFIDNKHLIEIEILTNEEFGINNSSDSSNILKEGKSIGTIKVFDSNGKIILVFDIKGIIRAELPKFPTTTVFLNIEEKFIYQLPNENETEKSKVLKFRKIKILKSLGLVDGGIYLHGNDGKFNLYSFKKLHILSMNPIDN